MYAVLGKAGEHSSGTARHGSAPRGRLSQPADGDGAHHTSASRITKTLTFLTHAAQRTLSVGGHMLHSSEFFYLLLFPSN